MPRPWIATYRVQFGPDFSFDDAAALAPYFAFLGISHLYASPIAKSGPGSTHGYDVCDPTIINEELGGEPAFRRLAKALHRHDIGILLDIVPNHMATSPSNPYWMDLLEFGQDGPSGEIFDVDWSRKLSLPWLTEDVAADQALEFDAAGGRILAPVGGARAPIRPRSVAAVIEGLDDAAATRWRSLESGIGNASAIKEARDLLQAVAGRDSAAFDRALADAGIAEIVADQHWRGIHWRKAATDLTYRRFFAVAELIGVRVEIPAVFELVHALPLRLLQEGLIDGLRVDHVDGLADPARYCRELRDAAGADTLLLLEKILGAGERLRDWPVDGTTGYEHLDAINQLFIARDGRDRFRTFLGERGGLRGDPESRMAQGKTELLQGSFDGEVENLVRLAAQLIEDVDRPMLKTALTAFIAWFPVYRSYATAEGVAPEDRVVWAKTLQRLAGHVDEPVLALAAKVVDQLAEGQGEAADTFRQRLQQLTSPAMAKGVEDTELYRDVSLVSANEVGVDLGQLHRTRDEFIALFSPPDRHGLIPLATHDTKRGPDTRARINTLSEQPDAWIAFSERWIDTTAPASKPDVLDQWLILQTLFGAAPISGERMAAYVQKALREASRHSSWSDPDEAYENAAIAYAHSLSADSAFEDAFRPVLLAGTLAGRRNGAAQTILQLTLPGTPDIYQGTELWEHSLVDPDNRRAVDWPLRRQLIDDAPPALDLSADEIGATKLVLIQSILAFRRSAPGLFTGTLDILDVAEGWFACYRAAEGKRLLVVVPLQTMLDAATIALPRRLDGRWTDVLTKRDVTIEDGEAPIDPAFPFLVLTGAP